MFKGRIWGGPSEVCPNFCGGFEKYPAGLSTTGYLTLSGRKKGTVSGGLGIGADLIEIASSIFARVFTSGFLSSGCSVGGGSTSLS